MTGYIIRRLLQAVVVVLGVTMIAFGLEHLIPGGIARAILGPRATNLLVDRVQQAERLRQPAVVPVLGVPGPPASTTTSVFRYKLNRSVDSIIAS